MSRRSLYRTATSPFSLVVAAVVAMAAVLVVTEMVKPNDSSAKSATTAPAVNGTAHVGDGVCAESIAYYHDLIESAGALQPVRARNDVLNLAKQSYPASSKGTVDAYFALFTGSSGKIPPVRMRVWIVEINNLNEPWDAPKARPAGSAPAPSVVLHHQVFVLNDSDLTLVSGYSCV
jgi:hypothetical protein